LQRETVRRKLGYVTDREAIVKLRTLAPSQLAAVSLALGACAPAATPSPTTAPAKPAEASKAAESKPAESKPAAAPSGEPVRIGALCDLTGATSDVGAPYCQGEKDYVEFVNTQGGVKGRPVQLFAEDYEYKVPRAEELYNRFVNQEKVIAIMATPRRCGQRLIRTRSPSSRPPMPSRSSRTSPRPPTTL
jgi:hypothetical protein